MSARNAVTSTTDSALPYEGRFAPALSCCLQHWYELRLKGERIGSVNNKRFTAITSQHKMSRRLGLDALRGAIVSSVKGERAFEAVLLPIGAALFPDALPFELVMQNLRSGTLELRSAAVFASSYYAGSDLSVEIAEQVILGTGDRLILQAMKEVLDLRGRTDSGGACPRCGARGTRHQQTLDWLPHRTM